MNSNISDLFDKLDGRTILVTGATGLIGSNLCKEIIKNSDARVIAIGRSRDKIEKVFGDVIMSDRFSYIVQDISEPFTITEKVDYIFHAAGPISGAIISGQPIDVIMPNIIGIKNCADFLIAQEKRIGLKGRCVVFSSATVYTNDADHDRTVNEDDTEYYLKLTSPDAPYRESKRMVEIIATSYCKQFDVDMVIARIGYVYGYCVMLPDTAFYGFIKTALSGKDIVINNPAMSRRDNIYIDDCVAGLLTVCERGIRGEAYNVSSGGELGNFAAADEMAKMAAEVVNEDNLGERPVSVRYSYESDKRQPGIKLDNAKLKDLGWRPVTGIREGIRRTIHDVARRSIVKVNVSKVRVNATAAPTSPRT